MITTTISIRADQKDIPVRLFAVEGESQAREFQFVILGATGGVLPLTNAIVSFYIEKPDKNLVMLPAQVENNKASVVLTLQACTAPGEAICWIQIVYADKSELRIDNIRLFIQPCNLTGATESTPEFSALQEALGDIQTFSAHLTDYDNPHQVNGNQIRSGTIRGKADGGPYFNLDAANGSGEIRFSSVAGVDDKARLHLLASSSDPTRGWAQIETMGADGKFQPVFFSTPSRTAMQLDNAHRISVDNEKINFITGGYARASIEDNGAYFSNLYQNGNKVFTESGGTITGNVTVGGSLTLQTPLTLSSGGTGAGTSVDARRNLGFGKLLWSGSWSSGNITVPELNDYVLFLIRPYGTACNIVAAKIDGNIRGVGVHGYDNQQTLYSFLSTVSGNTLTSIHSFSMQHNVSSTHGAKVGVGIYEIYGIC